MRDCVGLPQQYVMPSAALCAQVDPCPAVMISKVKEAGMGKCANHVGPGAATTLTGVVRCVLVPSPSCPPALLPQA